MASDADPDQSATLGLFAYAILSEILLYLRTYYGGVFDDNFGIIFSVSP